VGSIPTSGKSKKKDERRRKKEMRLALAAVAGSALFFGPGVRAAAPPQSSRATFSHYAIHVRDLQKSAAFYGSVLGLQRIPVPFKAATMVWFRLPPGQLHLIGGATELSRQDSEVHLAVSVASVEAFAARLRKLGIGFEDLNAAPGRISTRGDGVHQLYLQDPDGYSIEVNDDRR
jgi:lactoylglutathione lyase